MQRALRKLEEALRPLGIEPSLDVREIDEKAFKTNPSESNRIWIAGKPMEEWLGASVGSSRCCSVCGDSECRTVEVGATTFETIPSSSFSKRLWSLSRSCWTSHRTRRRTKHEPSVAVSAEIIRQVIGTDRDLNAVDRQPLTQKSNRFLDRPDVRPRWLHHSPPHSNQRPRQIQQSTPLSRTSSPDRPVLRLDLPLSQPRWVLRIAVSRSQSPGWPQQQSVTRKPTSERIPSTSAR